MKTRLAAVAASTGFAATALFAGMPAGAQPAPLPLTIDPTSGPVGTEITISGAGCLGEAGPGAINIFVDGEQVTEGTDPENPNIADDEGNWVDGITPLEGSAEGTYEITAECVVNDGAEVPTVIATYGPAAFELTAAPTTTTAPPAAPAPEAPAPATPVVIEPTFTG